MQIIHLTNIHLGGATPGAESGGTTPTPPPTPALPDAGRPYVDSCSYDHATKTVTVRARNQQAGEVKNPEGEAQAFPIPVPEPPALPDAGKPYVEGVTYDPDTKRVRLQARVAQAGEVKTPVGEVQEFPIHVPTPPPTPALPDAGKAYADSCTYDHATRTVTVHARNPQAGEVKSPDGETRQFHIEVPEVPQVTGVVYEYDVTNMSHSLQLVSADDEAHPGELYPYGGVSAALGADSESGPQNALIYSYVKPFPEGIQLSPRPLHLEASGRTNYTQDMLYISGCYLMIKQQVGITD